MPDHFLKRRAFLKKMTAAGTGAVLAPLVVPAKALGLGRHVAPSDRITMGCIGVGGQGTANMQSFLREAAAQVVAVCDVDRKHMERAARLANDAYGNSDCAQSKDFRDIIARKDIDTVMIATPDHWHAIIANAAARSGKDIFCEKPIAYTIGEGRAIVDTVQRYGRIWQTGSWQRSQQHFRFACELVRNGRIGEVHTVRVGLPYGNGIRNNGTAPEDPPEWFDYDMWLGPAPWRPYNPSRCHWNFRWISDYSGGQLTDWAGHHIDIAHWGMGTERSGPTEVEGRAVYPPAHDGLFDTPESYYFSAKYREGFTMIVADRQQQPKGMGVHFIGSEGWVHVSRGGTLDAHPKSLLSSRIRPNEIHLYESNNHAANFLDSVRTRRQAITPVDVAHHSVLTGHLGVIAMKLGRKVVWQPEKEQFLNDPEADRYLFRPYRRPWHL